MRNSGAKGFSQDELSCRTNVDENTLKRIYRNPTAVITTETLDKLAKARGVDASVLIESVPDGCERNEGKKL